MYVMLSELLTRVFSFLLTVFLLGGTLALAAVNPTENITGGSTLPKPVLPTTTTGGADDKKKNDDKVEKKKKECDAATTARGKKCTGATGNIRFESDPHGRYQCIDKKLPPEARLRVHVPGNGEPKCISQHEASTMTGNPACSNERGSTSTADPATCVNPTFEVTTAFLASGLSADRVRGAGIRCFQERTTQENGRSVRTYFICGDPEDQKKFQNLTRQAAVVGSTAVDASPIPDDKRTPIGGQQVVEEKPRPVIGNQAVEQVKPAIGNQQVTTPVAVGNQTVGPVRTGPLVGQQVVTEDRSRSTPVGSSAVVTGAGATPTRYEPIRNSVPFDTSPQRQTTGVQPGNLSYITQKQSEYIPKNQNSKISTVIQNYFSSSSQQQQQQQTLIINNAPQPWFIAEMKRMEEARAKAEAEKKLLAEKMKKEKEEKEKLEKDKKIAKGSSSTHEPDTKKTEKVKDEPTAEDSFLKALMEAPSIEEIAEQYQEEQRREQEQYVQEQTTEVTLQQSKKKGLEVKAKDVDEQESVRVVAQKKDRPQSDPYSDAKTVPATTLRPPLEKSSLIAMLDEQAIKKGIPAPLVTPMPLPEKISFTRTSYTVTVPVVRQTIKTIMRAYQRPGELTQLERDRHASQLMSISEQLAGSAYGADYDTTQVLNDTARASELTAFMVAEHADNTAIVDSLHTIFATLTPLTKSDPVALTPPTGSVYEWSEQHFALIKYKIETAMEDTRNDKARELYARALSLVRSAELYKESDQQYWNSSADIKDAVRTLSLATALDRASRAGDQEVTEEQRLAEQKAKTREALLKDKGQEKGIWSSFLNMLGL